MVKVKLAEEHTEFRVLSEEMCHAGKARVKDCLEEHREDPSFNAECKAELEKMMEHRATDFRLDSNLRELCTNDIDEMCGYDRVSPSASLVRPTQMKPASSWSC